MRLASWLERQPWHHADSLRPIGLKYLKGFYNSHHLLQFDVSVFDNKHYINNVFLKKGSIEGKTITPGS